MLNQLLRDERGRIGVRQERVHRDQEIVVRDLAGRDHERRSERQVFLRDVVPVLGAGRTTHDPARDRRIALARRHVGGIVDRGVPLVCARQRPVRPPRHDLRHFGDVGLRVRRDRVVARIEQQCPVHVQFPEPDREELHDLARVVLVRIRALDRVRLRVVDHVEVVAHQRVDADAEQDVEVIVEREVLQHLLIIAVRVPDRIVGRRNHVDLGQRPGNALAKLVGRGERVLEEEALRNELRVKIARTVGPEVDRVGGSARLQRALAIAGLVLRLEGHRRQYRRRLCELRVDIGAEAGRHVGRLAVARGGRVFRAYRAEGRMRQEPRGVEVRRADRAGAGVERRVAGETVADDRSDSGRRRRSKCTKCRCGKWRDRPCRRRRSRTSSECRPGRRRSRRSCPPWSLASWSRTNSRSGRRTAP